MKSKRLESLYTVKLCVFQSKGFLGTDRRESIAVDIQVCSFRSVHHAASSDAGRRHRQQNVVSFSTS